MAPGPWSFKIGGGTVVLAAPGATGDPLILNRIALSGQFDPVKKRFVLDQGDLGNNDIGVAMSGNADYSSGELHLAAGLAGTRMPADDSQAAMAGLCLRPKCATGSTNI